MTDRELLVAIFRGAYDRLRRGWCRGAFARDERGANCLYTAPNVAFVCLRGSYLVESYRLARAGESRAVAMGCVVAGFLEEAARAVMPHRVSSLAFFNDAFAHDVDDVLAVVRAAAGLAGVELIGEEVEHG